MSTVLLQGWVHSTISQEEFALKIQHTTVEQLYVPRVVAVDHGISLVTCVKKLHDDHVRSLVMTELRDGLLIPVVILTDWDITVKVVAISLDPSIFTAPDIMAQPLVTACPDGGIVSVLSRMRDYGVRRVPVVTKDGSLAGILSVDDIWETFAVEINVLERYVLAKQAQMVLTRPSASRPLGKRRVKDDR
jgi:CBS domain-containing protein